MVRQTVTPLAIIVKDSFQRHFQDNLFFFPPKSCRPSTRSSFSAARFHFSRESHVSDAICSGFLCCFLVAGNQYRRRGLQSLRRTGHSHNVEVLGTSVVGAVHDCGNGETEGNAEFVTPGRRTTLRHDGGVKRG